MRKKIALFVEFFVSNISQSIDFSAVKNSNYRKQRRQWLFTQFIFRFRPRGGIIKYSANISSGSLIEAGIDFSDIDKLRINYSLFASRLFEINALSAPAINTSLIKKKNPSIKTHIFLAIATLVSLMKKKQRKYASRVYVHVLQSFH